MPYSPTGSNQTFAFQGDKLLVRLKPTAALPGLCEIAGNKGEPPLLYQVSQPGDRSCSCVMLEKDFPLPEGMGLVSLRESWSLLGEELFFKAGRAFQLIGWHRETRFCGQCGNPMSDHETETAKICKTCGLTLYPPVSPAIIVAIERDGKLLLARSPHFPKGRFSVIAGFVEPGETLEQTVQREVFEEVGVRVRDIRYFGSQPWPFPHSLMVGFTAVWDSGEISVDAKEIEEAGWYAPDELPEMPPSISISRRLIDDFVLRHGHGSRL